MFKLKPLSGLPFEKYYNELLPKMGGENPFKHICSARTLYPMHTCGTMLKMIGIVIVLQRHKMTAF